MNEQIKIHHEVSGEEFSNAGEASADVKSRLKLMGVPADAIRRAAIALYEAEINLVIHAGSGDINVEVFPDKIQMRITDNGPGIADIELAMSEGYSTATEDIRNLGFGAGMGLPNMKKYSDLFHIESTPGIGTTIEMMVNIDDETM